jgi:hypothetical protein
MKRAGTSLGYLPAGFTERRSTSLNIFGDVDTSAGISFPNPGRTHFKYSQNLKDCQKSGRDVKLRELSRCEAV